MRDWSYRRDKRQKMNTIQRLRIMRLMQKFGVLDQKETVFGTVYGWQARRNKVHSIVFGVTDAVLRG